MTLRWRQWFHPSFGPMRGEHEVYWEPLDEAVYGPDPKPTIAKVGYTIVAQTLAAPLRQALERHLDEHGCGEGNPEHPNYRGGFLYCEEAKRIWDLLPPGDTILYA